MSSTQLTSTRITTYGIEGTIAMDALLQYPAVNWDNWEEKKWGQETTPGELRSLVEFLSYERDKYAKSGEYRAAVRRIEAILADLSRWPVDSCGIAYLYETKPGSPKYLYGDWLYFYYLDARIRTVTEITNAFR